MAILAVAHGQAIQIPAIQLTDGSVFRGVIKASDGTTLAIELDPDVTGVIPDRVDETLAVNWQTGGIQRSCPILVRSKSSRAIVGQVIIQERREAPRVRVEMQLTYEAIPNEKVKEVADEVLACVNMIGDPENQVHQLLRSETDPLTALREEIASLRDRINEMIVRIEDLAAIVAGGKAPGASGTARQPVAIMNCSSMGIGILTREIFNEGQYLRLSITLNTVPRTVIDCMGVVVRCVVLDQAAPDRGPADYDVGVRYTHIHESDRERLIHYLFQAQRRLLRDMKEARQAASGD